MSDWIIERLVGQCHVGTSHEKVLEHVKGCMKKGAWEFLPEKEKRAVTRECKKAHEKNRKMYEKVMGGCL